MKSAKVANAAKRASATNAHNATNATDQTIVRARALARARAIEHTLAWLRDHSSPRVAMSLMMACTVGCGFLASIVMHRVGITSPLIRYPLVVLIAWAVFLFLVGAWVWWHRRIEAQHVDYRDEHPSYRYDLNDAVAVSNAQSLRSSSRANAANDGIIATAATDRIAANAMGDEQLAALPRATRGSSSSWDVNFDGDDAAFLIIFVAVIAVAFTVFGVVFYAVYSAPAFFAELLIDGGVGTWIVKRMNVAQPTDAMSTAIKRSAWPVVALIAIFVALALAMHYVTPDATTLGQAWEIVRFNR
jgi:hypothetical protein